MIALAANFQRIIQAEKRIARGLYPLLRFLSAESRRQAEQLRRCRNSAISPQRREERKGDSRPPLQGAGEHKENLRGLGDLLRGLCGELLETAIEHIRKPAV